jgi:hypothetical protein
MVAVALDAVKGSVPDRRAPLPSRDQPGTEPRTRRRPPFRGPAFRGWSEQQKFTAGDAQRLDRFGFAVGIAGGTGLAGAPFHTADRGAVYLFGL